MADWNSRRKYWVTVKGIAQEAFASSDNEDEQEEFLLRSVDGNEWVIYTAGNIGVLRFSEADLETPLDQGGWNPITRSGEGSIADMLAIMACSYLEADALDALRDLRESDALYEMHEE